MASRHAFTASNGLAIAIHHLLERFQAQSRLRSGPWISVVHDASHYSGPFLHVGLHHGKDNVAQPESMQKSPTGHQPSNQPARAWSVLKSKLAHRTLEGEGLHQVAFPIPLSPALRTTYIAKMATSISTPIHMPGPIARRHSSRRS